MTGDSRPVALVLGARVAPDGTPSPSLRRRAVAGAALWQAGHVRAVIGSGGGAPVSEAAAILRLCHMAGVPEHALHAEPRARNTAQNIALARPLLAELGATQVIVVSDAWHLPRALLLARRAGLTASGHAPDWRSARALPQIKGALRELPAFTAAWLSGGGRWR